MKKLITACLVSFALTSSANIASVNGSYELDQAILGECNTELTVNFDKDVLKLNTEELFNATEHFIQTDTFKNINGRQYSEKYSNRFPKKASSRLQFYHVVKNSFENTLKTEGNMYVFSANVNSKRKVMEEYRTADGKWIRPLVLLDHIFGRTLEEGESRKELQVALDEESLQLTGLMNERPVWECIYIKK